MRTWGEEKENKKMNKDSSRMKITTGITASRNPIGKDIYTYRQQLLTNSSIKSRTAK
jgi:hypothetical protein